MGNKKELDEVVSDLMYIKNAISKNNNIFKFMNLNQILRKVYLIGAIVIIGFSGLFYYFIERHGGYSEIPSKNKILLYVLVFVAVILMATLKLTALLKAAKGINRNITVFKLFEEVYTTQMLLVVIPFAVVVISTQAFLAHNGLSDYLVPFLSMFIGLMCTSLVTVFYIKELIILGGWLIVTGALVILGIITLHPLLLIMLTFGAGFFIIYIVSFFTLASEKEC